MDNNPTEKINHGEDTPNDSPWGKVFQESVPEFRGDSEDRYLGGSWEFKPKKKAEQLSSIEPIIGPTPEPTPLPPEYTPTEEPTPNNSGIEKIEELKPVEELSKEEATREYMNALFELSSNFTSPEGKNARLTHKDGTTDVPLGYGGQGTTFVQDLYRATGKELSFEDISTDYDEVSGHFDDKYLDRGLAMAYADQILAAESDWRQAGAEHGGHEDIEIERAARVAKARLRNFENGTRGKLRKVFQHGTHRQLKNELRNAEARMQQESTNAKASNANKKLEHALAYAYAEDFHTGEHKYSYDHTYGKDAAEYQEQQNEQYNEMFFGDADRQKKIDRAIELRRKLQAEKVIK